MIASEDEFQRDAGQRGKKKASSNLHGIYKSHGSSLKIFVCIMFCSLKMLSKCTDIHINNRHWWSLTRLAREKLKYPLQHDGIWRLTYQYSMYLTVCLWAITTHPRIECQCVRVEPQPGQEWSKAPEERQRGLSGPNYIQSWVNWQSVKQERSSWWEQQARWAKVACRHF